MNKTHLCHQDQQKCEHTSHKCKEGTKFNNTKKQKSIPSQLSKKVQARNCSSLCSNLPYQMTQRPKRKTSPLAHSLWPCSWWGFSSHCHADWGTWSWSFLCLRAGCKSYSRQGGLNPPGSPSAEIAVAWGWRWMAGFAWGWLVHGSRSSSHSCLLSGSRTHGRSRRSSWSARGQTVRSQILEEQGRRWEGCCVLVQCLGNKWLEGNSAQSLTRWCARRSSCALCISLFHPSSHLFAFSCQLESSNGQRHQAWRGFFLAWIINAELRFTYKASLLKQCQHTQSDCNLAWGGSIQQTAPDLHN